MSAVGVSRGEPVSSVHPDTVAVVLRRKPLRLLVSSWPTRAIVYLLMGGVVAVCWVLLCWPMTVLAGVPLGAVERLRLRLVDDVPPPSPHRPPERRGAVDWIRTRLREPETWTELVHGMLLLPTSMLGIVVVVVFIGTPMLFVLSPLVLSVTPPDPDAVFVVSTAGQLSGVVFGLVSLALGCYAVVAVAAGQHYVARVLLRRNREHELDGRIAGLTGSRARITATFDTERRRIERDLHDGAQQRLTSVIMTLGLASHALRDKPSDRVGRLVNAAHDEANRALQDLRDLVNGIYPAALSNLGLVEAVRELAVRCSIPVGVRADLAKHLNRDCEMALYFAISELLTNVVKHSGAECAVVRIHVPSGRLCVEVEDNGRGGADKAGGSGLLGVEDRVDALGGTLRISSPQGGPTVVILEFPCE